MAKVAHAMSATWHRNQATWHRNQIPAINQPRELEMNPRSELSDPSGSSTAEHMLGRSRKTDLSGLCVVDLIAGWRARNTAPGAISGTIKGLRDMKVGREKAPAILHFQISPMNQSAISEDVANV